MCLPQLLFTLRCYLPQLYRRKAQPTVQAARSGLEVGAARADRLEAAQPEAQPSLPQINPRSVAVIVWCWHACKA